MPRLSVDTDLTYLPVQDRKKVSRPGLNQRFEMERGRYRTPSSRSLVWISAMWVSPTSSAFGLVWTE
jgi:hypothetical protein